MERRLHIISHLHYLVVILRLLSIPVGDDGCASLKCKEIKATEMMSAATFGLTITKNTCGVIKTKKMS